MTTKSPSTIAEEFLAQNVRPGTLFLLRADCIVFPYTSYPHEPDTDALTLEGNSVVMYLGMHKGNRVYSDILHGENVYHIWNGRLSTQISSNTLPTDCK